MREVMAETDETELFIDLALFCVPQVTDLHCLNTLIQKLDRQLGHRVKIHVFGDCQRTECVNK